MKMIAWFLIGSIPASIFLLILWDAINFERPRSQPDPITRASRITAFATIAIFLATLAGAGVAAFQWSALNRQISIMEADQRPWVSMSATPTIVGPLAAMGNDVAMVPLHFKIKNTGKSPARHVGISLKMVGLPRVSDLLAEQERFCPRDDPPLPKGSKYIELSVFPGDEYEIERPVFVDPNEVQEIRDHNANKHLVVAAIVGCINYHFIDGERMHRTGIILNLSRKVPAPDTSFAIDLDAGRPVQPNDLNLTFSPFGNGPAY
jgi:hypothetical protein